MIQRQFVRWFLVGVFTNVALYVAYLGLTRSLLAPKSAMTVVYAAGVGIGFLGNRHWSFEHSGPAVHSLGRYLAAYGLGYAVNFVGLHAGVEIFGLPHEAVQAAMIVVVGTMMFAMQKYFVFAPAGKAARPAAGPPR